MTQDVNRNAAGNSSVEQDTYDRKIVPAETAARHDREGQGYKDISNDDPATMGQTVDKEGLANNYPIEPEMYIDEPGDLRPERQAENEERAEELHRVNQTDESGQLTMEQDSRSKGPGVI